MICIGFFISIYIYLYGDFLKTNVHWGPVSGDTPQVLNPANHPFQGRFLDGIKDIDLIWITLQPTTLRMWTKTMLSRSERKSTHDMFVCSNLFHIYVCLQGAQSLKQKEICPCNGKPLSTPELVAVPTFCSSLCEGMQSIWSDEFCSELHLHLSGVLKPAMFHCPMISTLYQHYITIKSRQIPLKHDLFNRISINRIYKSWRSVHRKKKTVFHCHGLMAGLRSHRGLSDSGMSQMRWDSCARDYLVLGGGHIYLEYANGGYP